MTPRHAKIHNWLVSIFPPKRIESFHGSNILCEWKIHYYLSKAFIFALSWDPEYLTNINSVLWMCFCMGVLQIHCNLAPYGKCQLINKKGKMWVHRKKRIQFHTSIAILGWFFQIEKLKHSFPYPSVNPIIWLLKEEEETEEEKLIKTCLSYLNSKIIWLKNTKKNSSESTSIGVSSQCRRL